MGSRPLRRKITAGGAVPAALGETHARCGRSSAGYLMHLIAGGSMRLRDRLLSLCGAIVIGAGMASASLAATAAVRSGDTLQLGETVYRLDGIDAPEVDQLCIDDHADPWSCGVEAREQLTRLIAGRAVRCDDLGPDKPLKSRRLGLCTDRKSTRLNSSHQIISYAVFCLKKKKK